MNRWIVLGLFCMMFVGFCFAFENQLDEHFERMEWPDGWVSYVPKYAITQALDPLLFEKIQEAAVNG